MGSSALEAPARTVHEKLSRGPGVAGTVLFLVVLAGGLVYAVASLIHDLRDVKGGSVFPFVLLGVALLVALGFEFVNGFHDTANAVATVIYTHSLQPHMAVVWSGFFNFLGVVSSSGAVAFGIISLLPVELILQVGSGAGYAMVFSLLLAAILWNLGTWYLGLPASSSHTLIGSILGVGVANQLMSSRNGASGVDWNQALHVGQSLLLSPLIGFVLAALLLIITKKLIPDPALYRAPEGDQPPPFWIRSLLMLTCTGVSFAHGSNDGQKGMGLIMLILVGTVPTAYALNRAVPAADHQDFIAAARMAEAVLARYSEQGTVVSNAREEIASFVRTREYRPALIAALRQFVGEIATELARYKELSNVPNDRVRNFRNDIYLVNEAALTLRKAAPGQIAFSPADEEVLRNFEKRLNQSTRFIPLWVKVAVALALGLGTMVGWKRIVVTVGEKIGKDHLTYAQGASAEVVAMGTIMAADLAGLPVSTTHVLSSGVAGTMAANRSGLQWSTVRALALAWVLTLPASMALSAGLFWCLTRLHV